MGMLTEKQRERVDKQLAKKLPDEKQMRRGGRAVVYAVVGGLMKFLFRTEIVYPERVPQEGAVLLCSNHTSYFDIPLIHLQLERWTYWVARESLFRSRFTSRFLPWWGAMPIDVNNPDASQIKRILGSLKDKKMIGIFPQGTRCKTPEKLRKTVPRSGAVSFAIRTNATVLPVMVEGGFKLFRKTRIIVGEPFTYDLPKNHKHNQHELQAMTIRLMERIFALAGKEYPLENKEELLQAGAPQAEGE